MNKNFEQQNQPSPKENNKLEKDRKFISDNIDEILSSPWGAAINLTLMLNGAMDKKALVEYLLKDHKKSEGENLNTDELEKTKSEIENTIDSLAEKGVIVEEDGNFKLKM